MAECGDLGAKSGDHSVVPVAVATIKASDCKQPVDCEAVVRHGMTTTC